MAARALRSALAMIVTRGHTANDPFAIPFASAASINRPYCASSKHLLIVDFIIFYPADGVKPMANKPAEITLFVRQIAQLLALFCVSIWYGQGPFTAHGSTNDRP